MKRKRLGLIHTSTGIVPIFQRLCSDLLPDVDVFNLVDDSLLQDILISGSLTPPIAKRVAAQIDLAEQAGANAIMVTCSSIGRAVEAASAFSSVPVLRVDQPMADRAISVGNRIGILATLSSTLLPTADLIERRAMYAKKEISVTEMLCEGAFASWIDGDTQTHDRIVAEKLMAILPFVDVVVLAQASMTRVIDQLQTKEIRVPVLSSPQLAVEYLGLLMN